jgi:hypothetical protein
VAQNAPTTGPGHSCSPDGPGPSPSDLTDAKNKRLRIPLSTGSSSGPAPSKSGSFGDGISRRGYCRSGVPDRRLYLTRSPFPLLAEFVACFAWNPFLALTLSGAGHCDAHGCARFFHCHVDLLERHLLSSLCIFCSTESVSEEPWDLRHETFFPHHLPIVGCGRYGEAGSAGSRFASFLKAKEGNIQGCLVVQDAGSAEIFQSLALHRVLFKQ